MTVWTAGQSPSRVEGFCSACGASLGVDTSGQPAEWGTALAAHRETDACTGRMIELLAVFPPFALTEAAG